MAEKFKIERASRKRVKLRLALQSPAGGGKTASSLLLARGMISALQARGQLPSHLDDCYIGVLDTERDSASLFSHLAVFDRIVLEPPYTVDRYLDALLELERVGYPVIIIDQISHEWSGKGGILAQVSEASTQNQFAAWNGPSQDHERFVETLLASPAHLICTMRAKTEYVLEDKVGRDGVSRKTPTRVGMQAQQRAGMEFEFTTVLDLTVGTNAVRCVKDRTELFTVGETTPRLDESWGVRMIDWVYTAKAAEAMVAGPTPAMRAEAVCAAGCRAIERAGTLPDLARVFEEQNKLLRAQSVEAGRDVVVPLLERLIAAKDDRKKQFEGGAGLVRDLSETDLARVAIPDPAPPPGPMDKINEIVHRIADERAAEKGGDFFVGHRPAPASSGTAFQGMEDDLPWRDDPPPG